MHDPVPNPPMSAGTWRKVRWICAFTGAWGVLTGYPLFVLISHKSEHLEGSSPTLQFFGVLLAALVVVTLTEWLRETIRGETTQRRSIGSILISILLLAIFEVFVIAYEEVSQASFESPYVLSDIAARVSGQQTPYAFLSAGDIKNPDAILRRLRDGLARQDTSSPDAWIVSDLAQETQWTFFPGDVSRPPAHDASLARLKLQGRLLLNEALPSGPAFLPTDRPQEDRKPSATPEPADTGNPLFEGLGQVFDDPPGSVQPEIPDSEYEAIVRKISVLSRVVHTDNPPMPNPAGVYSTTPPPSAVFLSGGPAPFALANLSSADLRTEDLQALLAVELNRQILHFDFYHPDAFRFVDAPSEVKPLLARHREALHDGNGAQRLLDELARTSEKAGSERDTTADKQALEERLERADAALLPVRRVVWLNRRLLEATFPGAIDQAPERADPRRTSLLVLGLLWILAGGVLGWTLATAIRRTHEGRNHPVRSGGIRGLVAGVVVVPAAVVSYVLLVRTVNVARDLWTLRHELGSLFSLEGASSTFMTSWLAPVAVRLEQFGDHIWSALFGVFVFLGFLAVLWVVLWFVDVSRLRRNSIIAAAAAVAFVNALLFDLNLMFVFVLVGLVWAIPSLFLGMSTPYLQTGSALPKTWGWIAIGSGITLVLLTLLRLVWPEVPWWLGVAGALLFITGVLMRNGNKVEDYWPLAALVLAFAVYGATAVAQNATFHGVLGDVHDLSVRGGSQINLWSKVRFTRRDESGGNTEATSYSPYDRLLARLDGSRFTGDLALDQVVENLEEQHNARLKKERTTTARRLELSIVGSLGFWLTVGLLAAWATVRPPVHR